MHDLPQSLLAHLQREARDERDRARASRVETEKQIAASPQQLDESRTLLQSLKKLKYGIYT
jgi:hypothetical protein